MLDVTSVREHDVDAGLIVVEKPIVTFHIPTEHPAEADEADIILLLCALRNDRRYGSRPVALIASRTTKF